MIGGPRPECLDEDGLLIDPDDELIVDHKVRAIYEESLAAVSDGLSPEAEWAIEKLRIQMSEMVGVPMSRDFAMRLLSKEIAYPGTLYKVPVRP